MDIILTNETLLNVLFCSTVLLIAFISLEKIFLDERHFTPLNVVQDILIVIVSVSLGFFVTTYTPSYKALYFTIPIETAYIGGVIVGCMVYLFLGCLSASFYLKMMSTENRYWEIKHHKDILFLWVLFFPICIIVWTIYRTVKLFVNLAIRLSENKNL